MVRMLTESSPLSAANPDVAAHVVCGVRALLLAAACTLLSGCGTLYLMQAASGQWQVLRQRVPVDTLLADPRTPPALRAHLQEARAARGVERGGGAGVLGEPEALVFPGRRLRRLPGLFSRAARPRVRRRSGGARLGCGRRRRARLLDPRQVRRPGALEHAALRRR